MASGSGRKEGFTEWKKKNCLKCVSGCASKNSDTCYIQWLERKLDRQIGKK